MTAYEHAVRMLTRDSDDDSYHKNVMATCTSKEKPEDVLTVSVCFMR